MVFAESMICAVVMTGGCTPFPGYVTEPTKCVAGTSTIADDGGVVRVRVFPNPSPPAYSAFVCG
jgi:hypothetical protein